MSKISRVSSWEKTILESNLQPRTRHLAHVLSCYMSAAGDSCFPGIARIAGGMGVDERTVNRAMKELSEAGFIKIEANSRGRGKGRATNSYTAVLPNVTTRHQCRSVTLQPDKIDTYNPTPVSDNNKDDDTREDTREIFDYWKEKSGHRRAALDDTRKRKIRARLKRFTPEQLKIVIDVTSHPDSFHKQNNYDWPETIFKNDAAVERHLDNASANGKPKKRDKLAEFVENQIEASRGV